MTTPPANHFTPEQLDRLDETAREQGVTIVVVGQQGTAALQSYGRGRVLNEDGCTVGTGERPEKYILLADGGTGQSRLSRSMSRLAAGIALAAASMEAFPASPRKSAASLFPRAGKPVTPGMDSPDLKRLRSQHERLARLAARYKPGR